MPNRLFASVFVLTVMGGVAAAEEQPADPSAPPPPAPEATAAGWSDEIIQRPLTLPKGIAAVYGDFIVAHASFSDPATGASASITQEALSAGVAYGVDDKLEIGAAYEILLHDFEAKGPLTLYGGYRLYSNNKLSIGGNVDLVIDFDGIDGTDLALEAGLGVRYLLTDKIALFTGNPVVPEPLGQHLHIGLNNSGPITFDIPVGIAVQPTPELYVSAQTSLAVLGFSNADNAFIFSDFFRLDLRAMYVVNKSLDVGVFFNLPDLVNAQFDAYSFGIGATYFAI